MKRAAIVAFLLWCGILSVSAESPEDVIGKKHPDMEIVLSAADGEGGLAAAVLKKGETMLLCVAAKENGAWRVVSEGDKALAGAMPSGLAVDKDAVTWRYTEREPHVEYRAAYRNGTVIVNGLIRENRFQTEYGRTIIDRTEIRYEDGFVYRSRCERNAKGDDIGNGKTMISVPGAQEAEFLLQNFSAEPDGWEEWMPRYEEFVWWPGNRHLRDAARYFYPDAEYLGGGMKGWPESRAMLQLLLKKKNGGTVLLCAADNGRDKDGRPRYALWESSPLPEGAEYGVENFRTSLCFPGAAGWALDVGFCGHIPGILQIYANNESLAFGWNRISSLERRRTAYGFHPWADIQTIDWLSLPRNYEEALQKLNTRAWAVVNNPNQEDRLHLRAKLDKESASLGKFYNGTPVMVLQRKRGWAEVSVGGNDGFTGWMMEKYLAFGEKGTRVEAAFPELEMVEQLDEITLHPDIGLKRDGYRITRNVSGWRVVGLVEGQSYIIMADEGYMGYVPQTSLWPGNG